jgi:hypothetical protein
MTPSDVAWAALDIDPDIAALDMEFIRHRTYSAVCCRITFALGAFVVSDSLPWRDVAMRCLRTPTYEALADEVLRCT